MRAKEFIKEDKNSKDPADGFRHEFVSKPMRSFLTIPGLGQYYDVYRYGIAIANAPNLDSKSYNRGPTRDYPVTVCYTDEEEIMARKAARGLGYEPQSMTSRKSEEPSDTNKKSPALNPGPIKRKN